MTISYTLSGVIVSEQGLQIIIGGFDPHLSCDLLLNQAKLFK